MRHVGKLALLTVLLLAGCGTSSKPDSTQTSVPNRPTASAQTPAETTAAPEPEKGVAWCPELPTTFDGDTGDQIAKLPATDGMPKLENGDDFKLAQLTLCTFNTHMLGLTDKERNSLPKLVKSTDTDQCSDPSFVQLTVGYCHSTKQFVFDASSSAQPEYVQGIYVNTLLTVYAQSWTTRLGAGPNGDITRHDALMNCVFGRVVGGLLKAKRIPASWEQLLGKTYNATYRKARDTGTCAAW